jgi:hypothetical protein
MKTKLLLIGFVCLTSVANAASCLSASQQKIVDRNYNNSKENYGYVSIDCNSAKLKNFCSDSYNVKMINTLLRMDVYDYENATGSEYSAREFNDLKKEYMNKAVKQNCQTLKKNFFTRLQISVWNN